MRDLFQTDNLKFNAEKLLLYGYNKYDYVFWSNPVSERQNKITFSLL